MNVPYNEINVKDAAKRIEVHYATVANWCNKGTINCVNVGDGPTRPRYLLTEKEVEHLRKLKKQYGNRFIKHYDKNWDCPKQTIGEMVYGTEPCDNPLEFEVTQAPVMLSEPKESETNPIQKPLNLDNITVTLSYMQDIKDRLSQIGKQKELLLEQVNDIDAEINQLTNEYSELKTEVIEAL